MRPGPTAALLLLSGCYLSHGPAAARDGTARDGGPHEADAATAGPGRSCRAADEGLAERCGCLAGLLRCDGEGGPECGPDACPDGFFCHAIVQVCVPLDPLPEPCQIVAFATPEALDDRAPPSPWRLPACRGPEQACAVASPLHGAGGSASEPLSGVCMPRAFCPAWFRLRGPERVGCYEPDGTAAASAASGRCPAPERPAGAARPTLPCGPGCETGLCPYWDDGELVHRSVCVGYAEGLRDFGLCAPSRASCFEGMVERNERTLRSCEVTAGEPCACVRTEPRPPFDDFDPERHRWRMFTLPRSHCRAYRRRFPDSVQCLDARGRPID